jgi:hypothetical protein
MSDSSQWPVNPKTKMPMPPRAQPGYYPGFSTLSQQSFWDDATRTVVLNRVENPPPIRFFSLEEATLMEAVCARLLPQDDRDEVHQIPLVNGIDERLYENRSDGYRYESMPPDPEAYHLGLQAIEAIAQEMQGKPFIELGPTDQEQVLKSLHDANPPAGQEIWDRMPPHRFWLLILQDVVEQYYAHPYAWDEIGFGGPAYPRAYMRLERGEPEPWEVREQRYAWEAPETALSGLSEPVGGTTHHLGTPGQGGTH